MTVIRKMNFDEVKELVQWAESEGWNPGINDAKCLWNLDPDGFLALAKNAKMVGGGAIFRHSDTYGFMGLFIVATQFRGQKLGTKLWFERRDRLLSRLSLGATIGLDGVDAMVPFYEKGGFKPYTRHRRFQLSTPSTHAKLHDEIVDLKTLPIDTISNYEGGCFPCPRPRFLDDWINQPGAISFACISENSIFGFGVMRPCCIGWKIGPLFANSLEIADRLFKAFQLHSSNRPIFLDAPDNNPMAIELCRKYQMDEVFGCVRMYHGPVPQLDNRRIFGITTLEAG